MQFGGADYVIFALAGAGGVIGLFIGFSGALAFLAGAFAAAAAGTYGYGALGGLVMHAGLKALTTGVVTLLVFGLVRYLVKRLVHGLLAQPGDAIFGSLVAAATGFGIGIAGVWLVGYLTGDPQYGSTLVDQARLLIGFPKA